MAKGLSKEELANYREAAETGSIEDKENPLFLFSTTSTKLIISIIKGEISAVQLAHLELKNRGLDMEGNWVGFKKQAAVKTANKRGSKRNKNPGL